MNVADSDDRDEELSEIQIAFNEGVKVGKYKGAKELIRTLQSLLLMPLSSDQDW